MFSTLIKYSFTILFGIFLIFPKTVFSQFKLSDNAQISILTCSKGDDLYNTFGHTAIRVKDDLNGVDDIFNYGMFSFGGSEFKDQLSFGVKFVRGKLEYWLGVQSYGQFVKSYQYQERWVYEQVLNLSQEEKQHLVNALIINYEPENRAYRYDFFFDNCSSRVRDILVDAVGPVFGDKNSPIHEPTDKSFIDLIDPYIAPKPWLDLGMDIMLGLPSSRKASKYEFMFLPYHLMEQISAADGLVAQEGYLIEFPERDITKKEFHLFTPFFVFTLILLAVSLVTYRNFKANKHWFWLDRILLFISGLMGSLFLFMWLGTDHLPAHVNLNMFWALPFNIIAFAMVKNKKWMLYFKFAAGICAFILLAWFLSPQQYHLAIIPLALTYLVRYASLLHFNSEN